MDHLRLAREMVASLDVEQAARSSFRNYHAVGLDYLCLHRDPRLTVKLYLISPDVEKNDHDWLVWPHNHRYSFESITLAGVLHHHRFNVPSGKDWWLHAYDAGSRASVPLLPVGLEPLYDACGLDEEEFTLGPNDLHTIGVGPHGATLLQFQYHDRQERTVMIAPTQRVDCGTNSRLYRPWLDWQIRERLADLPECLRS